MGIEMEKRLIHTFLLVEIFELGTDNSSVKQQQ